jgi:hypothetical protein
MSTFKHLPWVAAGLMLAALSANAHPYASAVTNNNGTVQFILNENATSVTVTFDSGVETDTLGALAKGSNSFSLGVHTNYAINVYNVGSGAFTQTSDDSSNAVQFIAPRAVAVNVNPQRSAFGRIYVVNSWPSVFTNNLGTTNATGNGRLVGRGIYAINGDGSDAVDQGTNPLVGNMVFGTSVRYSPYRVSVGSDDNVYVGDLSGEYTAGLTPTGTYSYSLAGGGIWWATSDFSSSGDLFMTNGLGTVYDGTLGMYVSGSISNNTLKVYSDDWANSGGEPLFTALEAPAIFEYTYDSVTNPIPFTNTPNGLISVGLSIDGVLGDMTVDPKTGNIFAEQDRTSAAGDPGTGTGEANNTDAELYIYDPTGSSNIWESGSGGPDIYDATFGVAVSPDGQWLACATGFGSVIVTHMTNGIPDLSTVVTNQEEPNPTTNSAITVKRGVAFDAADNVITTLPQSPGGGIDAPTAALPAVMREYSPGYTSLAITSNDSTSTNGSFTLSLLPSPPKLTGISTSGGVVTLTWTALSVGTDEVDTTESFDVLSSTSLTGEFTPVDGAVITQPGGPNTPFQATITATSSSTFYIIGRF